MFNRKYKEESRLNQKNEDNGLEEGKTFESIRAIFDHALQKKLISESAYNRFVNPLYDGFAQFSMGGAIIHACMKSPMAKISHDELFCIIANTCNDCVPELKNEPEFQKLLSNEVAKVAYPAKPAETETKSSHLKFGKY